MIEMVEVEEDKLSVSLSVEMVDEEVDSSVVDESEDMLLGSVETGRLDRDKVLTWLDEGCVMEPMALDVELSETWLLAEHDVTGRVTVVNTDVLVPDAYVGSVRVDVVSPHCPEMDDSDVALL